MSKVISESQKVGITLHKIIAEDQPFKDTIFFLV